MCIPDATSNIIYFVENEKFNLMQNRAWTYTGKLVVAFRYNFLSVGNARNKKGMTGFQLRVWISWIEASGQTCSYVHAYLKSKLEGSQSLDLEDVMKAGNVISF